MYKFTFSASSICILLVFGNCLFEYSNCVGRVFKNILGNNIKISKQATKTIKSSNLSFTGCALKCEFLYGCESFNFRDSGFGQKSCELFDNKEYDILNKSESELGSTYFEKVIDLRLKYFFHQSNK